MIAIHVQRKVNTRSDACCRVPRVICALGEKVLQSSCMTNMLGSPLDDPVECEYVCVSVFGEMAVTHLLLMFV